MRLSFNLLSMAFGKAGYMFSILVAFMICVLPIYQVDIPVVISIPMALIVIIFPLIGFVSSLALWIWSIIVVASGNGKGMFVLYFIAMALYVIFEAIPTIRAMLCKAD